MFFSLSNFLPKKSREKSSDGMPGRSVAGGAERATASKSSQIIYLWAGSN